MTAVLVCFALTALVLGAGWALLLAGMRAGDRLGDTTLAAIAPDRDGGGVRVTVHNPGGQAVLLGASVVRRSLRLRCEAGYFVTVPRRASQQRRLARRHPLIRAVAAGETESVIVPVCRGTSGRAELIVAVGEPDRLRVLHRAVDLTGPQPRGHRQPSRTGAAPRPQSTPAARTGRAVEPLGGL